MILGQQFKTGEGARKRASFENAHSKTHTFTVIRFRNGVLDLSPLDREAFEAGEYVWRIQKLARPKAAR